MCTQWLKNLKKSAVMITVLATFAACSKGADFRTARVNNNQSTGIVGNGSPATCGGSQASVLGRVYDNGASGGYTFEQRVKGLLAASVDPQYFGTISGDLKNTANGVSLEGRIRFDSAGVVDLSKTTLKLLVTDSYVGTKDADGNLIAAYPMNFSKAESGNVDVTAKTFTITFKDSYGEIIVTGSFKTSLTSGTITYKNYSTVATGDYPYAATLGAFQISTCALIE